MSDIEIDLERGTISNNVIVDDCGAVAGLYGSELDVNFSGDGICFDVWNGKESHGAVLNKDSALHIANKIIKECKMLPKQKEG